MFDLVRVLGEVYGGVPGGCIARARDRGLTLWSGCALSAREGHALGRSPRIEYLSDFARESFGGERLLEVGDPTLENAVPHDRIVRVA